MTNSAANASAMTTRRPIVPLKSGELSSTGVGECAGGTTCPFGAISTELSEAPAASTERSIWDPGAAVER